MKTYVYDDGKYVATLRRISGETLGFSIPQEVRRSKGLYPGSKVMITIEKVKKKKPEEEDEDDGGEQQ